MMKICLVTEELAGLGVSGGIGGAFSELAEYLARQGMHVDVVYCPTAPLAAEDVAKARIEAGINGVGLYVLDCGNFVHAPYTSEKRSYSIYRMLQKVDGKYDVIHFHDYKGLGFFSIGARSQGLAFRRTKIVVQLHGPTGWVLKANEKLPAHPEQLKIDYLERRSVERADELVSPSQYLVDWMKSAGYLLPSNGRVHVIKNICTSLAERLSRISASSDGDVRRAAPRPINEIVLFARHEERKGFITFCDALDIVSDLLEAEGIRVTFLGKFGSIGGRPSGVVLAQRAKNWRFPITVCPYLDRDGAARYLAERPDAMVVIPSPEENSPYTVLEAVSLRKRILTSVHGGAPELIDKDQHGDLLCLMEPASLARKLESAVKDGLPYPRLAEPLEVTESNWMKFHSKITSDARAASVDVGVRSKKVVNGQSSVVLGITHYERPEKLIDAVISAVRQTYRNLKIVVVDDGSKKPETILALEKIEVLLERCGGMLIRTPNGYLGAARNAIANATESEYLCFLDDDDIAFPGMIERLVECAVASDADVVNCLNVYMPESRRLEAWPDPSAFEEKVTYVPTGGPLSLAPIENCFGAATALIKRSAYKSVGGYTELKGVGYEDYEFFVKLVQAGAKIEICPEVLYLYEVDRPSMINSTSESRNIKRVIDSIDFTNNSLAWRDLVALRAGQVALERSAARTEWERRRFEHGDLLADVENPGATPEQRLTQLAAYARAIGSQTAEIAFSQAKDSLVGAGDNVPARYLAPIVSRRSRSRGHSRVSMRQSVDLKVDIALGRYQQVVDQVVSILMRGEGLTGSEWKVVRDLTASAVVSLDYSELLRVITHIEVDEKYREDAYLVTLHAAKASREMSVIRSLLETAIDSDSLEYLERYRDVAAAVRNGSIESALEHYKKYGRKEQRKGFDLSSMLAAGIDKRTAVWDVFGLIDHMEVDGRLAECASLGEAMSERLGRS